MKKKILAGVLIGAGLLCTACGSTNNEEDHITVKQEETQVDETVQEEKNSEEGNKEAKEEANDEFSFADLAKYRYEFSSGAGAWATEFEIEKDGYFHGNYYDADMGGEVMSSSVFTGNFSDLTKVDDYTYEMTLESISYKDEVGTQETIDGVEYTYTEAYGLTGTDKFLIYLPGKAVSDIDEEVYSWIQFWTEDGDTLPSPLIVNEPEKEGIYSVERDSAADEAESIYNSYKNSYDSYMDEVSNAYTTVEMVDSESGAYTVADDCLNELWILVKYNNDEETYNTILEEQRAWLKDLDEGQEEAKASAEGGSLAEVDRLDYLATTTMDRCKELLNYIK